MSTMWMALAMATGLGGEADGVAVWGLPGGLPCDARVVLAEAIDDEVVEPWEAHRVAACERTTAMAFGTMHVYRALSTSIEAHEDDPEALAAYAQAVATLRSGLLGDAVRLALHQQVAEALQGAEPGPWQATMRRVAEAEPGPRPAEDPPVFRAMLRQGILDGPGDDTTWWQWGHMSLHAIRLLAMSPIYVRQAEAAQRAVDAEDPAVALRAAQDDWSGVPNLGIFAVTEDLLAEEAALVELWDGLLDDM